MDATSFGTALSLAVLTAALGTLSVRGIVHGSFENGCELS